jgi:RNA polymerase sigma-70 factor (ECF subfamily)
MRGTGTRASASTGATATPEDRQWVRAAVARFEGPLTNYAARLLGDAEGARDVVQDTFLRLCVQDRAAVEPHLAEWLFTVCRNRALDVLRKEGRMARLTEQTEHSIPGDEADPLEALERREDAARALRLLEALPPSQREVIRLKFQHGFSYREISRISGHSVSNVGFLIHVGMKALRGRMTAADASEPRIVRGEGRPSHA